MKKPVLLIGIGEMGGVFARGFLRAGRPVFPVTRVMTVADGLKNCPDPEAIILAVGENELDATLKNIPTSFHDRIVLLQNELLPKNWLKHNIKNPTVISVWFEKKSGTGVKTIIPSPVYGPKAELVQEALAFLNIPSKVLRNEDELLFELILKNLYILTINICGLKVGGTVGELWSQHQDFARSAANDVLDIQFHLAGKIFDREHLISEMVKAFEGDLKHGCMGRTAPARLQRAIQIADEVGLHVLTLKYIAEELKVSGKA